MTTLTSEMAADMARESMEQGGEPVEAHGLTFKPGAGFFVGTIGDMQSAARNVRIGEVYGEPEPEQTTAPAGPPMTEMPATVSEAPSTSLDADDPAVTLRADEKPLDVLIEAAHTEALAENAARDALGTADTDPELPKPPRKRKAPRA